MDKSTCSVDGCEGVTGVPGTARGLCSKHYNRFMRYGDVTTVRKRGRAPGPGHHMWKVPTPPIRRSIIASTGPRQG